jgi:O-antigen/teichoic acid export membrane protein
VAAAPRAGSEIRNAGVLAVAGVVANISSLLATILIARPLGERDYGVVVNLVGMFLVLAIPGSALLVAVVRRVTAWESMGLGARVDPWVRRVRRLGYVALGVVVAAAVASRWWVADVLNLPGPAGVTEVLVAGAGWAMLSVDRGLLQAQLAYRSLAASVVSEAAARTVLTLGLVAVGVGVEAASLGLLGALVAGDVVARRALARRGQHPVSVAPASLEEEEIVVAAAPVVPVMPMDRRHLAIDVLAALAALALLAALQNLDAVIVGREAPANRGAYGAISVACKALIFAALVLCGYLLPEAATRSHRGEHALRQLAVALGLLAIPAVGLCVVALVAPETLLRLVFGPKLVGAADAFFPLALGMTALAIAVLLTHYLLGFGRRRVVFVLVATVIVNVVLLTAANGDPVDTARADLACNLAMLIVVSVMVWRTHRPTRHPPLSSDVVA